MMLNISYSIIRFIQALEQMPYNGSKHIVRCKIDFKNLYRTTEIFIYGN